MSGASGLFCSPGVAETASLPRKPWSPQARTDPEGETAVREATGGVMKHAGIPGVQQWPAWASIFLPPYSSWPALCQPRTPDSCATSAPALSMGSAGPLAGARRGQLSQN
ncbi:hypothetical protein MTO96_009878 [Rhipicephalus appendiculatus]